MINTSGHVPSTHMRRASRVLIVCMCNLRCRQDFQTEEEWQQYKSLREANPKAAYQLGIKASDGRQKPKVLPAPPVHVPTAACT
jgi:hypothetical protein